MTIPDDPLRLDELSMVDKVLHAADEGRLDRESLYSLDPWRAARLARTLCRGDLMTMDERDAICAQARLDSSVPLRIPPRYR